MTLVKVGRLSVLSHAEEEEETSDKASSLPPRCSTEICDTWFGPPHLGYFIPVGGIEAMNGKKGNEMPRRHVPMLC